MSKELSISLEGLDGAGKSTVAPKLAAYYQMLGHNVACLTSPSKTPRGMDVRQRLFAMDPEEKEKAFLDDLKASQETITSDTEIAVWDRHLDSMYTSNKEMDLERMAEIATDLRMPDVTCYLQLSVGQAYERALPITDHPLDIGWLALKYDRYEELLGLYPDRIHAINASQKPEAVMEEITYIISNQL